MKRNKGDKLCFHLAVVGYLYEFESLTKFQKIICNGIIFLSFTFEGANLKSCIKIRDNFNISSFNFKNNCQRHNAIFVFYKLFGSRITIESFPTTNGRRL